MFLTIKAILFATSMCFHSRYFVPICYFSHYSQHSLPVLMQQNLESIGVVMQFISFKNHLFQMLKMLYKEKLLGFQPKLLWYPSEKAPKPPCCIFQFPNSWVTATALSLQIIPCSIIASLDCLLTYLVQWRCYTHTHAM